MKLDIGSADKKPAGRGWVSMDNRHLAGVDIIHDWTIYPWPFEDCTFSEARAWHVMEHVDRAAGRGFIRWMDEVHRILQPGAPLTFEAPYAGSPAYYQDPTHVNPLTERVFLYFDPQRHPDLYAVYRPAPWRISELHYNKSGLIRGRLIRLTPAGRLGYSQNTPNNADTGRPGASRRPDPFTADGRTPIDARS